MKKKRLDSIKEKFADDRCGEVIFVSHCLLNENTRYFGGAFQKGFSLDILNQIHEKGYGIIQLPCPEQIAWGGLMKPSLWLGIDNRKSIIYPFRGIIYRLFIWHTNRIYSRIARKIIRKIQEYHNAGYSVKGIIGIGGSPTCGVKTSLDLSRIDDFMNLSLEKLDRDSWNKLLYSNYLLNKSGLFISILKKKLGKKNFVIPFYEFDILKEMNKENQNLF